MHRLLILILLFFAFLKANATEWHVASNGAGVTYPRCAKCSIFDKYENVLRQNSNSDCKPSFFPSSSYNHSFKTYTINDEGWTGRIGDLNHPLSLEFIFSNPKNPSDKNFDPCNLERSENLIQPGDIIWVHDKKYDWQKHAWEKNKSVYNGFKTIVANGSDFVDAVPSMYVCKLIGSENNPILIRAYPKESPIIDSKKTIKEWRSLFDYFSIYHNGGDFVNPFFASEGILANSKPFTAQYGGPSGKLTPENYRAWQSPLQYENNCSAGILMDAKSAHIELWDLEITNSSIFRSPASHGSSPQWYSEDQKKPEYNIIQKTNPGQCANPVGNYFLFDKKKCPSPKNIDFTEAAEGVSVKGKYIKLINLNIHDNFGDGITAFGAGTIAEGVEIHGCMIYHNGWKGPPGDRSNGHGIYSHTDKNLTPPIRKFYGNSCFSNFDFGFHLTGSADVMANNYDLKNNVLFSNGSVAMEEDAKGVSTWGNQANIFFGWLSSSDKTVLENNHCYVQIPDSNFNIATNVEMGRTFNTCLEFKNKECVKTIPLLHTNAIIKNNYFIGGATGIKLLNLENSEFNNNYCQGSSTKTLQYNRNGTAMYYGNSYACDNENILGLNNPDYFDFNHYIYTECYSHHCADPALYLGIARLETCSTCIEKHNNLTGCKAQGGVGNLDTWHKVHNKSLSKLSVPDTHSNVFPSREAVSSSPHCIALQDLYDKGKITIVVWNWPNNSVVSFNTMPYIPLGNKYKFINLQQYKTQNAWTDGAGKELIFKLTPEKKIDQVNGFENDGKYKTIPPTAPFFNSYIVRYFPYKIKLSRHNTQITAQLSDVANKEVALNQTNHSYLKTLIYVWEERESLKDAWKSVEGNDSTIPTKKGYKYQVTVLDPSGMSVTEEEKN